MRYMILMITVIMMLTGCTSEVDLASDPAATKIITPSPSEPYIQTDEGIEEMKILSLEPSLHIEQLQNDSDRMPIIEVRSNIEIDKKSFEKALQDSLVKSVNTTDLNYYMEWVSPTFVQIRFHISDENVFSFIFNLDQARTVDGREYKNKELHNYNEVVVLYNNIQPSLSLYNPSTNERKLVPVWDSSSIKVITEKNKQAPSILFYGKNHHYLYDPQKDHTYAIAAAPMQQDWYGNDYGNHEWYSDRFYSNYTYLMLGNKIIYKVNLENFKMEQIYVSDKPIYGMSSSPDGSKIVLLLPENHYLGPFSEIIVLDNKGKVILEQQIPPYGAGSDGFLFGYKVSWLDNENIIIPAQSTRSNPSGSLIFNIKSKQLMELETPTLTSQIIDDILQNELIPIDSIIPRFFWSPDQKMAAFQLEENQIWVYNSVDRSFHFVGVGTLLVWLPEGDLVWTNTKKSIYTF